MPIIDAALVGLAISSAVGLGLAIKFGLFSPDRFRNIFWGTTSAGTIAVIIASKML